MCSTPWCYGDCDECESQKKYEKSTKKIMHNAHTEKNVTGKLLM